MSLHGRGVTSPIALLATKTPDRYPADARHRETFIGWIVDPKTLFSSLVQEDVCTIAITYFITTMYNFPIIPVDLNLNEKLQAAIAFDLLC